MRNKNSKSFLAGILAALMMISLMSGLALALSSESNAAGYKIVQMGEVTARTQKGNYTHMEESEEKTTDPNEIVTIIVALEDDPVLETYGTLSALQSGARTLSSKGHSLEDALLAKQAGIAREISNKLLDGKKVDIRSNFTLIFNGFSFDGPFHLIEKIKGIEGVKFCEPSMMFDVPKTKFDNNLKPAMHAAADMVTAFGA
ncbi:MAG: hypothetical protein GX802_03310, partial [Clostridiales bacterium]|nr:hypothetical protein [Clostridiales bacterium]